MKAEEAIALSKQAEEEKIIPELHKEVCEKIRKQASEGLYGLITNPVPERVCEILRNDGFYVKTNAGITHIEWKKKEVANLEPAQVEAVQQELTKISEQNPAAIITEQAPPVVEVLETLDLPQQITPAKPEKIVKTLRIAFLGNFQVDYTSESHHVKSLEALGHQVFKLQESQKTGSAVLNIAKQCDVLVWVHTHGWKTPGLPSMKFVLEELKKRGIPTLSYHLDLWKGLKREQDMKQDEVWNIAHFFTVDKLMSDWFNEELAAGRGITKGHYIPAGVFHGECNLHDVPKTNDVIFVGSRGYHSEWNYRVLLLDWLAGNYKDKFQHWGDSPLGGVRGQKLNDLYHRTKIVIGDTLCLNFNYPYYYSDRIFETLGRGGFMIHPYIKGIEEIFEDKKHCVFYEYNNFGQLKELIDYYLTHDEERETIRRSGHEHVKANHTYMQRWEQIISEL